MTEKRFTVKGLCIQENSNKRIRYYLSQQGSVDSLCMRINQLFEEYNKLEKENKELTSILQDMGLIMSNEEVKNVRDEIASKVIKPLCKGNGFDVDINTENGFTIIPKVKE